MMVRVLGLRFFLKAARLNAGGVTTRKVRISSLKQKLSELCLMTFRTKSGKKLENL